MQSVNQTDQLDALGFKMNSRNYNLSRGKSELILENEMRGARKEIQKKKRKINTATRQEKSKLKRLGNMGLSYEYLFREFRKGVADRRTICVYNEEQTNSARP